MKMSVRLRLTLAFGSLALLSMVTAAFSINALGQSNERFTSYINGHSKLVAVALEVRGAVNERAIAARNLLFVFTDADKRLEHEKVKAAHARVKESITTLERLIALDEHATDEDFASIRRIAEIESQYGPVALDIVGKAVAGESESAIEKLVAECRPLLARLIEEVTSYAAYSDAQAQNFTASAQADYQQNRTALIVVSVTSLVVAILLGVLFIGSLMRSLGAEPAVLAGILGRIAAGDLTPVYGADKAKSGSVLASLDTMQHHLIGLISQVRDAAHDIADASARISRDSGEMSERTSSQAGSLQQTSESMSGLGARVNENAENSNRANQLAQEASDVAVSGGEVVGQVVATMEEINEDSKQIAAIIGVINDISFQTNILALNAAVEAARAGEQGRGFAVVAGEVGSLAQRSTTAAKEIEELVKTSVNRVEQGTSQVTEAVTTISGVVGSIQEVARLMGQINSASDEQRHGVTEVGDALRNVESGTSRNASMADESLAAAEQLRSSAGLLVDAVSRFKFKEGSSASHEEPNTRELNAA